MYHEVASQSLSWRPFPRCARYMRKVYPSRRGPKVPLWRDTCESSVVARYMRDTCEIYDRKLKRAYCARYMQMCGRNPI